MSASHGAPTRRKDDPVEEYKASRAPEPTPEPKPKKRGLLSRAVFNKYTAIFAIGAGAGFAGGKYDIDHTPRDWASKTFNSVGDFLGTSGKSSEKKLKEASEFVAPKEDPAP